MAEPVSSAEQPDEANISLDPDEPNHESWFSFLCSKSPFTCYDFGFCLFMCVNLIFFIRGIALQNVFGDSPFPVLFRSLPFGLGEIRSPVEKDSLWDVCGLLLILSLKFYLVTNALVKGIRIDDLRLKKVRL